MRSNPFKAGQLGSFLAFPTRSRPPYLGRIANGPSFHLRTRGWRGVEESSSLDHLHPCPAGAATGPGSAAPPGATKPRSSVSPGSEVPGVSGKMVPACLSPSTADKRQVAAGRGDSRLALGAEPWGQWESVGFRGLAFLGLMGGAPFQVEVGGGREGDSRGLWKTEHPDGGPECLQLH